jgi:formate hydrogenlyase transcriptional activator
VPPAAIEPRPKSLLVAAKHTLEMIAGGASLTEILEQLCHAIDAQNPAMMSTVMLADPDGQRLWPAAGPHLPPGWKEATSPIVIGLDVGSCGSAAFRKEQVIVSDVANDPRWSGVPPRPSGTLAAQAGLRASWSQPLMSKDNEVLGTFAMYYAEPRVPSSSELQLIEDAARIAVIAIEGERAQTALKQAWAEIAESERRLRAMMDALPDHAARLRPDGVADYVNQRWHEYTGVSREDLPATGAAPATTIHPDDLPRARAKWQNEILPSGEAGEFEYRLRRHDGQYRWFIARVEPMRDDQGNLVGWCGTNTDIEDLKRAEEELRRDQEELRRITDAIPEVIAVLDPEGNRIYANRALLEYAGLTLEDMRAPDSNARFVHPEDLARYAELRRDRLARGIPFETELRTLGGNGQYRWFLVRYNPFKDQQGRVVRWYVTGTDIDDRKRAEDRMRSENLALREDIDRSSMFEEIVGSCLDPVLLQVAKVAETDSTVLILGETGTGKELIARAIHKRSPRSTRAFIRVNCAAIPPSLVASELFGHEKGAFTGALQRRLGRFEAADGGTILLDEIGELPPETQVALLRVLQEGELERVGSSHPITVDVRVLAATNRDLEEAVERGAFREDLYYRLNVFPIHVPPLRERVADIPVLVEYLVDRYAKKAGKRVRAIKQQTLELFQAYDWPGNVRELQNVIERAVVLCDGGTFAVDASWLKGKRGGGAKGKARLTKTLADREKALIESALAECHGKISGPAGAATKLGIPRQTLESKIKALRIDKIAFRRH